MQLEPSQLLSTFEETLVDVAGPIGKFVLKKQIHEMNITPSSLTHKEFKELIKRSVTRSVFDEARRASMIRGLVKEYGLNGDH